jgi:hypothetical protein
LAPARRQLITQDTQFQRKLIDAPHIDRLNIGASNHHDWLRLMPKSQTVLSIDHQEQKADR